MRVYYGGLVLWWKIWMEVCWLSECIVVSVLKIGRLNIDWRRFVKGYGGKSGTRDEPSQRRDVTGSIRCTVMKL